MSDNLLNRGLGNDFLNLTPKVKATRTKYEQVDYIKLYYFCTAKDTLNKMKREPKWEKIIINHISDKGLIS